MVKYLIILWIAVYLWLIVKSAVKLSGIDKAIKVLAVYLNSANISSDCYLQKQGSYDKNLENVFALIPAINRYLGIYDSCRMDYANPETENYREARTACQNLFMQRSYAVDALKLSFIPTKSLKTILIAPSRFLGYLGFKPDGVIAKLFSVLCWVAAYLLGAYQEEVKSLVNSFFK